MIGCPTKILLISSSGDVYGGGEIYLLMLIRHLDRQRFRPIVVIPWNGSLRAPLEELGVEVVVLEADYGWLKQPGPWYRLLKETPERVRYICSLIRERQVRLVHTHSIHRLEGALAARLAGVPHLYHAHTFYMPDMPLFQRFPMDQNTFARLVGELSFRIIAVSDSVAKTLSPPIPETQIQVIHNGLEIDVFERALAEADGSLHKELGVTSDAPLITAVGRIDPEKGFDDYLEAAGRVIKALPAAHFLLVGNEENKQFAAELHRRVAAMNISRNVHFLGFRKDVPRILTETDIFALASRREGLSFSVLEAMACGCAVVATRCGGPEEIVRSGITGHLVQIGDVTGMANAIIGLLRDPKRRRNIAEAGRRHVQTHFDAATKMQEMVKVYDEVLAEPPPLAGSPAVDLFLQATTEIGTLGLQLKVVEERLRQVEHLAHIVKENPIARGVRRVLHWLRNEREKGL